MKYAQNIICVTKVPNILQPFKNFGKELLLFLQDESSLVRSLLLMYFSCNRAATTHNLYICCRSKALEVGRHVRMFFYGGVSNTSRFHPFRIIQASIHGSAVVHHLIVSPQQSAKILQLVLWVTFALGPLHRLALWVNHYLTFV